MATPVPPQYDDAMLLPMDLPTRAEHWARLSYPLLLLRGCGPRRFASCPP